MKTILAPTDFSDVSENAVNYAAELAMFTHAKLVLFHGFTIPVAVSPEVPVVAFPFDDFEKETMRLLHLDEKRLKLKHPRLEIKLITRPGFIADEVMLSAKEEDADIIVMGVTGSGKTASVFGTTTTTLLKKTKCPVLVIPRHASFEKPKKMALACDYRAIVPDEVVNKFKDFTKLFGSKVLVFDVLKEAELVSYEKAVAEVNLENSLKGVQHSLYFPSGENLTEEVNEFVVRNKVDMLTVMPHNYNFLEGLFHHSNTKKIALNAQVPLLSIRE